MDLENLIIGLISAAILIQLRGAYVHAQKQRLAALQLSAYLSHWKFRLIDSEYSNLLLAGVMHNEQIREAIKNGVGTEGIEKIQNELDETIGELKAALASGELYADCDFGSIVKNAAALGVDNVSVLMARFREFESDLLSGNTYISDQDACYLPEFMVNSAIGIKLDLISIAGDAFTLVAEVIHDPDKFEASEHSVEISGLVRRGVLFLSKVESTLNAAQATARTDLVRLTLRNFF